jgi:hypothetical protein
MVAAVFAGCRLSEHRLLADETQLGSAAAPPSALELSRLAKDGMLSASKLSLFVLLEEQENAATQKVSRAQGTKL